MSIPRNTPQAVQDCPILQYASGKTRARPLGAPRFAEFLGFHIEAARDADLDRVLAGAGSARIEIAHPRPGGSEIKPHWSLGDSIRFHPITAGPPATTISGCLRLAAPTAEAGIGLIWPSGEKSRMAVRGFLFMGTTPILVQLSVRSTMTGALLTALIDHVRVCQIADGLVDRTKHPEVVALHEVALPLIVGDEIAVGRNETALICPLVSEHPTEVTRAYVLSCWRRAAVHEAALAAWAGVQAWAVGYRSGETNGDSHLDGAVVDE